MVISQAQAKRPLLKVAIPVSLISEGDFITDPWDYIWRVAKNVADTEIKRGNQVVLVQLVRIEEDVVIWEGPIYQIDYPAAATERRYSEDEIKELVS